MRVTVGAAPCDLIMALGKSVAGIITAVASIRGVARKAGVVDMQPMATIHSSCGPRA